MSEIIRTQGLKKHYHLGAETVRACDGIDLLIEREEFVAIMGPSGSGKSTFMNMASSSSWRCTARALRSISRRTVASTT